MKLKTLSTLVVIAAVLIIVAVFMAELQGPGVPTTGQPVFPELKTVINDVTELSVATQSGTITLHRQEDIWRVKEKYDYPADLGTVRETLIGLAELTTLEPKTRKPELYEILGVQDVDAEGSLSTGITLKDATGNTVAAAVIGNDRAAQGKSGYKELFIRKVGDPRTWLVQGRLTVEKNPGKWLDEELTQIETKRVRRLIVTHPDKTRLVVEKARPTDLNYQVGNVPQGLEIESQFTVNNIVSTVTSLSLDDVKPRSEVPFDGQPVVTAVFETFDGLQGIVQLFPKDENNYVTISAVFNADLVWKPEPERESEPQAGQQSDGDTQDKEADTNPEQPKIKSEAEVKAEIEALNKRVGDWVYVIPKFRADTLLKKPQDLLKTSD
ncbi:MAG: DUF4340 domain-containing protein [Nitrospira sp. SB0662_bin_26]|nr:DUF4340 domain-containing protein [Nitrospira sp. SB0662_bin_26]